MPDPHSPPAGDTLRASWDANAAPWTEAVRGGHIASRKAATDAAIVEAVLDGLPMGGRVLDIGCGEGWLARALGELGASVHGVDGSAALVEAARAQGGGSFEHLPYDQAAETPDLLGGPYDVAVFNFAILNDDALPILRAARRVLDVGGRVLVQTVHPVSVGGTYADGWRQESFEGIGAGFEPMPWYFRTVGSWVRTLHAAGLAVTGLLEPMPEGAEAPLSLLWTAEAA